jgi:hypothetical protein
VAKAKPGQKSSTVLSQTCVTTTPAAAAARTAAKATAVAACGCETILVAFFQNINYGGDQDIIWGHDGPCDQSGYGISSYKMYNNCNVSEKFTGYNFTGTYSGLIFGYNQSYIGATWNDKMKSFWLSHG